MKKSQKRQKDLDSENEFEILEVELVDDDIQQSAAVSNTSGRRRSSRLAESDSVPQKRQKTSFLSEGNKSNLSSDKENTKQGSPEKENNVKTVIKINQNSSDKSTVEKPKEEKTENNNKMPEFTSGTFVVQKTDFEKEENPSIWKIDGKALLRKYIPTKEDGKILYKDTNTYAGWTLDNKFLYFPAPVSFVKRTPEMHLVQFQKDQVLNVNDEKNSVSIENITLDSFENLDVEVISEERLEDIGYYAEASPAKDRVKNLRSSIENTKQSPKKETEKKEPLNETEIQLLLKELGENLNDTSADHLELLKTMLLKVKYGLEAYKTSKIKIRENRRQNKWTEIAVQCFINGEKLLTE